MIGEDMGEVGDESFKRFPLPEEEHRALVERARREVPAMAATVRSILEQRRLRRIESRRQRGLPPLPGDLTPPKSLL
jgi:hypothetical protein